jgi:signal transduction histidine kinase
MKRILIIDDAPEDREQLTEMARAKGDVTVFAFATGADGLDYFRTHGADCILLDHRLEGEDGLAILSALRSQSIFVPIIMMSGQGNVELAVTAIKSGATRYMTKSEMTAEKIQKTIDAAIQDCEQDRRNAGLGGSIKTVLLVEDNDDDRHHVAEMLSAAIEGCDVQAVATGTEAMAVFDAKDVDCVILDYRLEAEDGLTILHKMKKIAPFCPVIMLTGQGNEEVAAQSIKVGAADYLVKQRLTETYLRSAIENGISRAALETKVAEQEAQRRQFLNILVHDLRAPLRNVRSLGVMATEEADVGDIDSMKGLLASQGEVARRANELISTLEVYALMDGNVRFAPVSLKTIAEGAKNDLAAVLFERNAEVHIGDLPSITGHEAQLTQLLQNIIQNGVKYNESGRPRIAIESDSDSDESVIIVVSDNGIGIGKKHLETIFAPLKRLWGNSKYEGTGLGLAICRKVVERHGGKIWCTSTVDEGSQFHIRLPKRPN